MKISIIGHCGSGKTTLAKSISVQSNIPRLEIDRLFFSHGGTNSNSEEKKNSIREKIKTDTQNFLKENPAWVTDGVYLTSVQPLLADQADQIIILDIPLFKRMFNHLKRWFRNDDRHSEVSRWEDLLFTFDMIRRTKNSQPKIQSIIDTYSEKILVLKNYKEVEDYLKQLQSV